MQKLLHSDGFFMASHKTVHELNINLYSLYKQVSISRTKEFLQSGFVSRLRALSGLPYTCSHGKSFTNEMKLSGQLHATGIFKALYDTAYTGVF
jgi:hypothetical protein